MKIALELHRVSREPKKLSIPNNPRGVKNRKFRPQVTPLLLHPLLPLLQATMNILADMLNEREKLKERDVLE